VFGVLLILFRDLYSLYILQATWIKSGKLLDSPGIYSNDEDEEQRNYTVQKVSDT